MNLRLTAAATVTLAVSSIASASVIQFDPDGAGPAAAVNAASFDWLPGDALLYQQGPNQAWLLFQAKLGSVLDDSNHVIPLSGLNDPSNNPNSYEITGVFGVPVTMTSSGSSIIITGVDGSSSFLTYFSMYFDPSKNANNLLGTGFRDGTKIYGSDVETASAALVFGSTISPLDEFSPNFPGALTTNNYTGGGTISGATSYVDPAFFLAGSGVISMNLTNGTLVAPFTDVDPSENFQVGPDNNMTIVHYVINDRRSNDLPQLQLESDAATSFTAVPEPGTLLTGIPMLAMMLRRRSRQCGQR